MKKYRESVKNDPEKYEKIKQKTKKESAKNVKNNSRQNKWTGLLKMNCNDKKGNNREDLGQSKKKQKT